MPMIPRSRYCCRVIRRRRPAVVGDVRDDRMLGQRWHLQCGSLTARTERHPSGILYLACFSGVLQADAYAGFNELYRNGGITEAACWAHARRDPRCARPHPCQYSMEEAAADQSVVRHRGGYKGNAGRAAAC
ncbi:transposase [Escherichia coli]